MEDELLPELLVRTKDGRNVDPLIGSLRGEGAQMQVRAPVAEAPVHVVEAGEEGPSYYGLPMLKEPVWTWSIPAYLFVGGSAGASSLLAATLSLHGAGGNRRLARRARWLGAIGDAISAGLLIEDLGRPSRFLNMMRVFRPSSPMNVGTWILSASGACNSTAALFSGRPGALGAVAGVAGAVGGVLGIALSGYTAVLLSSTAVPVWQQSRKTLPLVFMCSAVASSASLLELMPHSRHEGRVLRRYGTAGKIGELAAIAAMRRESGRVPRVGRPLRQGASGALLNAGIALSAVSLVASLWPGGGRRRELVSGVAGVLGSLAVRFAIYHAGKASARDPYASFEQQRAGDGAAEVTGQPARVTTNMKQP